MMNTIKTTADALGLESNKSRFLNLEDITPWFENNYRIHELINDFWGLDTKCRLVAVSKDIKDQSWKGLVSEWDTGTSLHGQFRVNKPLINGLLKLSLGENDQEFKLKNISKLELSIFENFFVELENYWKDFWRISGPGSRGTYIYLIWVIELENKEVGSLAIGVPPGVGPKYYREKSMFDFRDVASGLDIEVPLDLSVGKSKLKISEIRSLEPGDLIVFEKSDTNYLIWDKNEIDKMYINIEIPGKDNPRFENLYYDELEMADMVDEASSNDDLLTDLPVELTAQFKSVNMPLQKILELESGGILPLGLLMDSKLTLMAPGEKPIASGNLVVVGNQFGIKIDKTNIKKPASAKLNPKALTNNAPAMQENLAESVAQEAAQEAADFASMDQQEGLGDDNLDKELEDIGIDPKELDELEDLY